MIDKWFYLAVLLMVMCQYEGYAQQINSDELKKEFPDEDVVFLQKKEHLFINFENDKWDIKREVQEDMLYLENSASIYAEKSIFYTSFEEINDLKAETKVPIKKGKKIKYKSQQVTQIETKDIFSGSVFYSDAKEKTFVFPATQKNAITKLSYTERIKDPHMLSSFYFTAYAPILLTEYKVTVPKHVEITYKMLGQNTENITFNKKSKEGFTTYSWVAKKVDKIKRETDGPSTAYYVPHLVVYISKVIDDGKETIVLKDVDGLYQWYYSLVKDINKEDDDYLKNVVAELLVGANDDAEKTKRIFQWVQSNIKYIAFEDGLGGFIPREAKDVGAKKYGDCKDMSSIIVEMLTIAEIEANLTWIGTRDRPYSYYEVPSPIVDNHMIASTKIDGQTVFLDATGDYQPFGFPTSMIQGKEALIGIDKNTYRIEKVPVVPKEKNNEFEIIKLSIDEDGKTLKGKASFERTGYKKVFAEYSRLRAEGDGSESKAFFNEFLRKGSNKFNVTEVDDKGFYDPNQILTIDYDFEIPDYVTNASGKLYVNLNLNRKYEEGNIDVEKRTIAKESEYLYVEGFELILTVPNGYELDYLPPNSSFEHENFGFEIKYQKEKEKIKMSTKVYMNFLLLEKDKFNDWNDMFDKLKEAYQEVVVLKKIQTKG